MANTTATDDFAETAPAGASRRGERWKRLRNGVIAALPAILFLALIIAVWDGLAGQGIIPNYIIPAPGVIGHEFATNSRVLLKHATATTMEALLGFLIGNIAAVVIASLLTMSSWLRDAFFPYALLSRAIPIVVFTPLFVVVLGRGLPPILAIVSFSVYFPTFLNMMRGLNSADADYEELLHTLSATPFQRLRLIQFPASMPFLFAALKVSASGAFIAAVVTEWIGASAGLGYLIVDAGQYFRLSTMWAAIFTAAGLTLALLGIVTLLERLLWRWTGTAGELRE